MPRFLVVALASVALMGLSGGAPVAQPPPPVADAAATPATAAEPPRTDLEIAIAQRFARSKRSGLTASEIDTIARTIVDEARRHEIDPHLVVAVIHV